MDRLRARQKAKTHVVPVVPAAYRQEATMTAGASLARARARR